MTWEEAGLISTYPEVMEKLRDAASRNMQVDGLRELKELLEYRIEQNNPYAMIPE